MKLSVYQFFISSRFSWDLMVYNLPQSFLDELDVIANRFVNKWSGEARSANVSIFYRSKDNFGLHLKQMSCISKRLQVIKMHLLKHSQDPNIRAIYDLKLKRDQQLRSGEWRASVELEAMERVIAHNKMTAGAQLDGRTAGVGVRRRPVSRTQKDDRKEIVLQIEKDNILGLNAREIFADATVLGQALGAAFAAGSTLTQHEILTETGRRIQASIDFIHDSQGRQGLGALVTLHDLESVEEIGSELELSRRMAAIGRLTSGVGHEVKNPINAIVVHLELLRNKLGEENAPASRHLEIIDSEIHRLDRVVQTLVDFTRPVELDLREQDLRVVIGDVLALAADEFSMRNVTLVSCIGDRPLLANVDGDLLKQAVLNVMQNGAQAMPEGGKLEVTLEEQGREAVLRIRDEGTGIPEEIQEKIFDLYFTTKSEGTGIGLAMTYRILQFHHGSVEVKSRLGHGAEFLLCIPLATAEARHRRIEQQQEGLGE